MRVWASSDGPGEHRAAHVAGLRAPGWAATAWPQLAPAQAKQAKPRWRLLSYSVLLPGMRLLRGHQALLGDKKCTELIVNIFCFEWYQNCHVSASAVSQTQSLSSLSWTSSATHSEAAPTLRGNTFRNSYLLAKIIFRPGQTKLLSSHSNLSPNAGSNNNI